MHKTIQVDERRLVICGREGDLYFDHLDLGDHTNDFLLYAIKHYLPDDAIVLDIGANIGVTSALLATAAAAGKVYAFEPDAAAYPFLIETLEANGMSHCHPKQMALAAAAGEAVFHANPETAAHSHLVLEGVTMRGATARVKVATLDQVAAELGLQRLDFIKIDVEGFELEVLEGGKNTIAAFKPHVFIEFNSFTLIAYGNKNPRHVLEHLRSAFPHVYCFIDGRPFPLTDAVSMHTFLHDNLVKHGCVDDLLCTFEPVRTHPMTQAELACKLEETQSRLNKALLQFNAMGAELRETKGALDETISKLEETNWKLNEAVSSRDEAMRQLNDVKRYAALKKNLRSLLRR